ncbi:MAG: DNA-binding protein [Burkholderiales bacterium]|nr:DNA-binding protein [Burkholderiales bacterium]
MSKPGITYDEVKAIIIEMVNSGEKITVKNLISRTGGNIVRISDFIKQWRSEQEIQIDEKNIPDDLKLAIIKYRSSAISDTINMYKNKIEMLESLNNELKQIVTDQTTTMEKIQKQMEEYKNYMIMAKENNNTHQITIEDLKKQLNSLQDKLELTTKEKYEAEKNTQIWEFKYNEISKKK